MRHRNCITIISTVALTLMVTAPLTSQDQKPQPQQKVEKLSKWPALKATESERVRSTARQFKKPQEKLHAAATKRLIATGPAVAPIIIPMVNDRPESINDNLFEVLDAVLNKKHSALLARETKRPSVEWRRYLIRKLATFHDAELAPVFKNTIKDKDADIAAYGAIALLSLGNHDGLEIAMLAAKQRWAEFGDFASKVLAAGRSEKGAMPIFKKIESARPTDQMAGLRLLRYLIVQDQRALLKRYLESSDFTVKKEAINTARVLFGEKPLDKLSSFQAIDQAKTWLNKLSG
jgi:hypothetical protein